MSLSEEQEFRGSLTPARFQRRFRWLVFHSWMIPPVFGLGFIWLIGVLNTEQILAILTTPLEPAYCIGWLAFAMWYLPRRLHPVADWLAATPASSTDAALNAVRRFPLVYWVTFLTYLVIAPASVVVAAEIYTDFETTAYSLFRIELIALIVSIIVGLPIFFLMFDLFGEALGGLTLTRPVVTIRTKVFLIGALIPLLIDTMLVQYYWTRTGFFTFETFGMWLLLELLAIGGSLIFVRSFGQSLRPLQAVIEHGVAEAPAAVTQAQSTDELGVLANDFRLLLGERRKVAAALHREKELAQVTLASIGDGVITTDNEGRVTFINAVAEYLTGWTHNAAQGRSLQEMFDIRNELTGRSAIDPVRRCLREGHIVGLANHTVLVRPDGRQFAIEDSAAPIRDGDGAIVGVVLVFHDVTRSREMANRLAWQAAHDPLTGLYNRAAFEDRLRELQHAAQDGETHVLLYIDLDQFKVVNDVAGHVAGDEMLRQITGLMQQQVRESDMLARLGGDEFGVILTRCSLGRARGVADSIHAALDALRFRWDERVFRVGASIGVLEFKSGDLPLTELLSAADVACYAAKTAGRRRTHIYVAEDAHTQRHRNEMNWAARVAEAVEHDRFVLYGQPILPLNGASRGAGKHFEVLVRLRDEDGSVLLPDVFLPAAERFDLMPIVDRWIIARALSQVAACLKANGGGAIRQCAINLSGVTLGDDGLLPFIKSQLALHALPASVFCFEITETAAISNFTMAGKIIQELKMLGCRFALDDFGSGMSSFSYLRKLPVDFLKIDGAFVSGIVDDPVSRTLVGNINDIGHLLGKRTIAEYAEDEATVEVLRELGVDLVQGFAIGYPEPLSTLLGIDDGTSGASGAAG